jgi:hypothetical protein
MNCFWRQLGAHGWLLRWRTPERQSMLGLITPQTLRCAPSGCGSNGKAKMSAAEPYRANDAELEADRRAAVAWLICYHTARAAALPPAMRPKTAPDISPVPLA